MSAKFEIRDALPSEYTKIGELLVTVYSQLEDFPTPTEQPAYYKMLENIGELTKNPGTRLFAASTQSGKIGGAVVYFSDMAFYGSGGIATKVKNAGGFRLLAVDPDARGHGLGKLLTQACINEAKKDGAEQVIIHSTKAMKVAWEMYEKIGFERSEDLDFIQKGFPVFGFRLWL